MFHFGRSPQQWKKIDKIVSETLEHSAPLFIISPQPGPHGLKEFWLINKLHLSFKRFEIY